MRRTQTCTSAGHTCAQIRSLYTELALHPDKDFDWGKGKENARQLGYDAAWLERLPEPVWQSAAAAGNPFDLGRIHAGETVLDLGCGAGADACIAALLVGSEGWVIGVDATPAMVEKARSNAQLAALTNVEVHEADMARLPFQDACSPVWKVITSRSSRSSRRLNAAWSACQAPMA
jgi:arsenite methyltransferase